MKNFVKKLSYILMSSLLIVVVSCDDAFEYSPYAANVKSLYKDIGEKNRNAVIEMDTILKSEYKFAVFCDPHFNYDKLNEAVLSVNRRNDIDFVIVNGDITDHGYLKEFELFHETMKKLKIPYLTTIGNHDYRSNGEDIYKEMYGKSNYTFEYNNNLFIMWDDVFWESNKSPDWEWLENELENIKNQQNVFVVCHIPPFSSQFDEKSEEKYTKLMSKYNINLSIHGHTHSREYSEYYNDEIQYLVGNDIKDEEYSVVTVANDIVVEFIKY